MKKMILSLLSISMMSAVVRADNFRDYEWGSSILTVCAASSVSTGVAVLPLTTFIQSDLHTLNGRNTTTTQACGRGIGSALLALCALQSFFQGDKDTLFSMVDGSIVSYFAVDAFCRSSDKAKRFVIRAGGRLGILASLLPASLFDAAGYKLSGAVVLLAGGYLGAKWAESRSIAQVEKK